MPGLSEIAGLIHEAARDFSGQGRKRRDVDSGLLRKISRLESNMDLMNAVNYLRNIRNLTQYDQLSKQSEDDAGLLQSFKEWTQTAALYLQNITDTAMGPTIKAELDTFVTEANDYLRNLTLGGSPLSYVLNGQNESFPLFGEFSNLIIDPAKQDAERRKKIEALVASRLEALQATSGPDYPDLSDEEIAEIQQIPEEELQQIVLSKLEEFDLDQADLALGGTRPEAATRPSPLPQLPSINQTVLSEGLQTITNNVVQKAAEVAGAPLAVAAAASSVPSSAAASTGSDGFLDGTNTVIAGGVGMSLAAFMGLFAAAEFLTGGGVFSPQRRRRNDVGPPEPQRPLKRKRIRIRRRRLPSERDDEVVNPRRRKRRRRRKHQRRRRRNRFRDRSSWNGGFGANLDRLYDGFNSRKLDLRDRDYVYVDSNAVDEIPGAVDWSNFEFPDDYDAYDVIDFKELDYDQYDMDQFGNLDFTRPDAASKLTQTRRKIAQQRVGRPAAPPPRPDPQPDVFRLKKKQPYDIVRLGVRGPRQRHREASRRALSMRSFVSAITSSFNFSGLVALALVYVLWQVYVSTVVTPSAFANVLDGLGKRKKRSPLDEAETKVKTLIGSVQF